MNLMKGFLRPKHEASYNRYGHIDTKFFHYVTPGMIISVTSLVAGIISGFTMIKGYFMHNPPLNGSLLLIEIVGLYKAFGANISIFNVACFLKKVEDVLKKGNASPEDIAMLRKRLEKKAHLLSMAPVTTLLNNLETYGSLNLKDDAARLIKSKLGSRITHLRGNVNYFCGIMVMLGLIGTFWGLLKTISDVGGAMTKISESMGGTGNIDMGEFLQSISKPLEGMGVGFSASLFGLGGSLFLGFFNYIATYVHDHFIENFARWLDDRIPQMPTKVEAKTKAADPLPGSDDLKAWLAGFVFLAKESNQRMSQLFSVFAESNKINSKSLQQIEKLHMHQNEVLSAVELSSQKLTGIHNTLKSFAQDSANQSAQITKLNSTLPHLTDAIAAQIKSSQLVTDAHAGRMDKLLLQAQNLSAALTRLDEGHSRLEQSHGLLTSSLAQQAENYRQTTAMQLQNLTILLGQIQQTTTSVAGAADLHTELLQEIKSIKRLPSESSQAGDISSLVIQVNALLEEISDAGEEGLLDIIRKSAQTTPDTIPTDA